MGWSGVGLDWIALECGLDSNGLNSEGFGYVDGGRWEGGVGPASDIIGGGC